MEQYIKKSAVVVEIEKIYDEDYKFLPSDIVEGVQDFKDDVLRNIDTLEVKEVDDELQKIEKEITECSINAIDRKYIPIVLKGEIKAKFKNEFNTLWQTVGRIQFANVAKHIIERLCLHFAAWGVYNLKGYGSISSEEKHKMDIEVKKIDLELITHWFDHIAQIADDRKTANGAVMEDWAALDEIKCLAKNSSEFIKMHYKAQKGE